MTYDVHTYIYISVHSMPISCKCFAISANLNWISDDVNLFKVLAKKDKIKKDKIRKGSN